MNKYVYLLQNNIEEMSMQNFNIVCFNRFIRSTRLQQPTSPDIATASADLHNCTSWQTIHLLTFSHLPLLTTLNIHHKTKQTLLAVWSSG